MPAASRVVRVLLVAVLALVLAGCRLHLTAEVVIERDGSGSLALVVAIDPELLAELDALAVDPTIELEDAVARTDGWSLTRAAGADGGLVLTVGYAATDPARLTGALRELAAGLGADDPALLIDLDVAMDEEGAVTLSGTGQLRAPAGPGVLDDPGAPSRAELEALVAETVSAQLVVTLPATPTDHDADLLDGRTLTWTLTTAGRQLSAFAPAPSGPDPRTLQLGLAVAAGLVVLGGLTAVVLRRRRRG